MSSRRARADRYRILASWRRRDERCLSASNTRFFSKECVLAAGVERARWRPCAFLGSSRSALFPSRRSCGLRPSWRSPAVTATRGELRSTRATVLGWANSKSGAVQLMRWSRPRRWTPRRWSLRCTCGPLGTSRSYELRRFDVDGGCSPIVGRSTTWRSCDPEHRSNASVSAPRRAARCCSRSCSAVWTSGG